MCLARVVSREDGGKRTCWSLSGCGVWWSVRGYGEQEREVGRGERARGEGGDVAVEPTERRHRPTRVWGTPSSLDRASIPRLHSTRTRRIKPNSGKSRKQAVDIAESEGMGEDAGLRRSTRRLSTWLSNWHSTSLALISARTRAVKREPLDAGESSRRRSAWLLSAWKTALLQACLPARDGCGCDAVTTAP